MLFFKGHYRGAGGDNRARALPWGRRRHSTGTIGGRMSQLWAMAYPEGGEHIKGTVAPGWIGLKVV
jgi:hypothetical protein